MGPQTHSLFLATALVVVLSPGPDAVPILPRNERGSDDAVWHASGQSCACAAGGPGRVQHHPSDLTDEERIRRRRPVRDYEKRLNVSEAMMIRRVALR